MVLTRAQPNKRVDREPRSERRMGSLSVRRGPGQRGVGLLKGLAFLLNGGNYGENYRDRWRLFQEQK